MLPRLPGLRLPPEEGSAILRHTHGCKMSSALRCFRVSLNLQLYRPVMQKTRIGWLNTVEWACIGLPQLTRLFHAATVW